MSDIPLGKPSDYPSCYAPERLHAVARADAREALGIHSRLPFSGVDIWNAWELTWLDEQGKPRVAAATLRVPATSPNIVESKSLKLYLNSLANTRFESVAAVEDVIAKDVANIVAERIDVDLHTDAQAAQLAVRSLPGQLLDELDIRCPPSKVAPELLAVNSQEIVNETLHSHLLRSLCPVTGQPDNGSLLVHYAGPRIEHEGLLAYLVSFREHSDFHEACIERMFIDIKTRCRCDSLTVYARYARRGGIDINPCRTDEQYSAENYRLWRQ